MQPPAQVLEARRIQERILHLQNILRDYRISLLATQGARSRAAFLAAEIDGIRQSLNRLPALEAELPQIQLQVEAYAAFHSKTYGPCVQSGKDGKVFLPQTVLDIKREIQELKFGPRKSGNPSGSGKGSGRRRLECVDS